MNAPHGACRGILTAVAFGALAYLLLGACLLAFWATTAAVLGGPLP